MALSTYTELKAAIADYLDRSDLTSQIVDFITLAEAEFNRTLFVAQREEVSSASASSGTITLPSDFWAMRAIYIDSDPKVFLHQMSLGNCGQAIRPRPPASRRTSPSRAATNWCWGQVRTPPIR